MAFPFRISQLADEGILQGSKWLTYRLLVNPLELKECMEKCSPLFICNVAELVSEETALLSQEDFLRSYTEYVEILQGHEDPDCQQFRPFFSAAWSRAKEALCAFPSLRGKWMIKPLVPVVQLSAYFFSFSPERELFHSMVRGGSALSWGLQFSYPQFYAQSNKGEPLYSLKDKTLPNHALVTSLKSWVKASTKPARFHFQGKTVIAPFRISQQAAHWMSAHPALKRIELELKQ